MDGNTDKLRCGGCGNFEVVIHINKERDLFAECSKCKSVTSLTTQPKIQLGWTDGSKGILCIF